MGTEGSTPERAVPLPLEVIDQVPELIQGGFTSVKVWTTNATTRRPRQMMDFGHVAAVMERVAAAGRGPAVRAHGRDGESEAGGGRGGGELRHAHRRPHAH